MHSPDFDHSALSLSHPNSLFFHLGFNYCCLAFVLLRENWTLGGNGPPILKYIYIYIIIYIGANFDNFVSWNYTFPPYQYYWFSLFYKLRRKISFTKEIYLFIYSLVLNVYSLYSASNTNSMQIKHHNKACTSKASHIIIFSAVFFWFTACISKASHIIICQILILFLTDRKSITLKKKEKEKKDNSFNAKDKHSISHSLKIKTIH